ncbi:hypothetical protein NFI96_004505 [Prochilodus magdalenae]|nr:hypothetical protein NFI96_004505 [Prochilodus magdalenae]
MVRVKLKDGVAFLGARPCNPTMWMVSQDVRTEGHKVVTLHCRRKESSYGQSDFTNATHRTRAGTHDEQKQPISINNSPVITRYRSLAANPAQILKHELAIISERRQSPGSRHMTRCA